QEVVSVDPGGGELRLASRASLDAGSRRLLEADDLRPEGQALVSAARERGEGRAVLRTALARAWRPGRTWQGGLLRWLRIDWGFVLACSSEGTGLPLPARL